MRQICVVQWLLVRDRSYEKEILMIWCLIVPAIVCVLLALLTLTVQPRQMVPRRPIRLLRGCAALFLLLLAGGLVGLAVLSLS